jgi:carnitine O-acetyltransferase
MSFFTAPLSEAEHALPPLPLPDIQRTLQKFITSCKPLATQQEIAELERDCELFARTHAPQLQAWLEELQRTNVSWLEGMWEQVAYLSWAEPLAVNSNYASPFPPVTAATPPEARVSQTLSASRAIITCLEFFSQLDAGSLKPDVLAGRSVDWSQYERLFCTTRCALPDSDVMVHHDPRQQQHIVVCAKDRVFALPVKGHSEHALDLALRHIIQLACDDSSRHADALSLPALTALPRRTLGGIVEILKRDKSNAHALDVFEKALFAVCLDDWEEYSYAGHVRQILHGNGRNRVYDKNFQLVIMPSGRLVQLPPPPSPQPDSLYPPSPSNPFIQGMNGEHTHSDAPVPARMIEYIGERLHFWTSADSQRYAHSASPPPVATELLLRCTDSTPKSLIAELQSNCESLKTCINVRVIEGKFGIEKLSKELSVSPDAFMQMCIQCAWRKVHGAPVAT